MQIFGLLALLNIPKDLQAWNVAPDQVVDQMELLTGKLRKGLVDYCVQQV